MRGIFLCVAALGLLAPPGVAQAPEPGPVQASPPNVSDGPAANPARPTVSTPATLTPVGYLQFETGGLFASHSPELNSQTSINEVVKLTVAPRLEFLVASEPLANTSVVGDVREGEVDDAGDVSLGVQAVILPGKNAKPTVSVSYLHRIYGGAAPDLDIGSAKNSLLLLISADVRGFHYDANAIFNEQVATPVRRAQFGQTLSISHPLAGDFSLTGEIWHFTQPFLRGNAVGTLWALSFAPRKNLVFDGGFDRGLTGSSARWEGFAGFTYLLPHRLW